ncbi:hypothetical protein [Nocardia nova]|uniref:hypothetical protein n=1 Tax=Nocardia nova TaxID=37330 RepID=UPI00340C55EB
MASTGTDNVPAEGNSAASPGKIEQLRAVAKLIASGGAKPIAAYYFAQLKAKAGAALGPRLIPVVVKIESLRQRRRTRRTPPPPAPATGEN